MNLCLMKHPFNSSTILVNLAFKSTIWADLDLVELNRLANVLQSGVSFVLNLEFRELCQIGPNNFVVHLETKK